MIRLGFLLYITLFFIFMQDCAILHPMLLAGAFFVNLSLFLLIIKNEKKFLYKIKEIYVKTPFKYLVWYALWALFSGLIIGGGFSVKLKIFMQVFLIFGLSAISSVLFAVIVIPRYISVNKIIKFFVGIYEFILVYGVLKFYIPMDFIHNILCNRYNSKLEENVANFNIIIEDLIKRATSVFFEPSFFATFLFLFMPFLYNLVTSDIRLAKNKNIDLAIKISLVAFTWLNLFLARSPIYIVFCLIYTVIYFGQRKYIKKLKKYFPLFLVIMCVSALTIGAAGLISGSMSNMDAGDKGIFKRVEKIIEVKSIEELLFVDSSLATRIISSLNGIIAGLHYPVTGTGYGNTNDVMTRQLLNSPVPLTPEIEIKSLIIGPAGAPPIIFTSTLLQTGIPGVILMYLFFILSITKCRQIEKFYDGNERFLLSTVILIAINYIVISIYWSFIYYPLMWFIFGILISYIYETKTRLQKICIEEQNRTKNYERNV